MNARAEPHLLGQLSNRTWTRWRKKPSSSCAKSPPPSSGPTLLFSGGKDSLVLLKCAEKAFGARPHSLSRC